MNRRPASRAFSLVELLAVVAVIAVLAVATLPAITSVMRESRLAQGGERVIGFLNLARQTALGRNLPVEVRFYQYALPGETSPGHYRAFQAFVLDGEGKATPVTRSEALPEGILFSSSDELSSLLGSDRAKSWTTDDPQPKLPQAAQYNCRSFTYRPDGDAGLSASRKWHVTLHRDSAGDGLSLPPANFVTIQVDPRGGGISVWRP